MGKIMKKIVCMITALTICASSAVSAFAGDPKIANPKSGYEKVAAKAKGRADDVINIAKTQNGCQLPTT